MIKFKLIGAKAAAAIFGKAGHESLIIADLKEIIEDVIINDMLTQAKANAIQKLNKSGTRKGTLASNIKPFVKVFGKTIVSGLFVDLKRVPYARIHELSGTITPKKGKFLTIPFPGIKGKARDFKDTFIAKGIIWQKLGLTKTGKRKRKTSKFGFRKGNFKFKGGLQPIKPLFSLVSKVNIKKTPYMRPALEKFIPKLKQQIKQYKIDEGIV